MRKIISFMVVACFLTLVGCGSTATPTPTPDPASDVTITLAPIDGATNQALAATVTAIFSAAITEPADWTTAFTLLASGGTETLCTEVAYDETTLTATCTHADLTVSIEHTISVSGVTDSAGLAIATTTAIFTTTSASENNATFTSKDSVTSIDEGDTVTLTFTFASAPASTPTIAVADASASLSSSESVDDDLSLAIAAGTCTVSESDATIYACTVTGVAGCKTLTDYTATISVDGVEAGTLTFNSADDEFTNAATLADYNVPNKCWDQNEADDDANVSISGGNLIIAFTGAPGESERLTTTKTDLTVTDYAILYYVSGNNVSTTMSDGEHIEFKQEFTDNNEYYVEIYTGNFSAISMNRSWHIVNGVADSSGDNAGPPNSTGDLSAYVDTYENFYVCQVRKDNSFKTYMSFDGSTFIEITTTNIEVGALFGTLENLAYPTISGADLDIYVRANDTDNPSYEAKFGYVRFKATGITGLSATDCPTLTAN